MRDAPVDRYKVTDFSSCEDEKPTSYGAFIITDSKSKCKKAPCGKRDSKI